ncbi:MAG: hypothetical protein PVI26_13530, partial [Chitinispirillia bacterium]
SLFDILWKAFNIKSKKNFIIGNTNLDQNPKKYPLPSNYSSDLSLYFNPDSIPVFLESIMNWPSIGCVDSNKMGGGTIPARERWDKGGVLTIRHQVHDIYSFFCYLQ